MHVMIELLENWFSFWGVMYVRVLVRTDAFGLVHHAPAPPMPPFPLPPPILERPFSPRRSKTTS